MNLATFTPPPWKFAGHPSKYFDATLYGAADTEKIASLKWAVGRLGQTAANKHLIAAAPDLLESCNVAIVSLEELLAGGADYHYEIKHLRDSIAKATGEQ